MVNYSKVKGTNMALNTIKIKPYFIKDISKIINIMDGVLQLNIKVNGQMDSNVDTENLNPIQPKITSKQLMKDFGKIINLMEWE